MQATSCLFIIRTAFTACDRHATTELSRQIDGYGDRAKTNYTRTGAERITMLSEKSKLHRQLFVFFMHIDAYPPTVVNGEFRNSRCRPW